MSFDTIIIADLPECGIKRLNEGILYVVATPIGNLNDISPRARDVLQAVDLIAAEDTRVTGRLLMHFGIKSRQTALHEHNESAAAPTLIASLKAGKSIALVSDAGTPLISDPGFRLLQEAHRAGITVSPIPGASALIAALSASGLPTDRFVYEGFLPAKQAARRKRLCALATEARTVVFYESVHRVVETVNDLIDTHGADRGAFLGRELTKLFEQCISADLQTIAARLADGSIPAKGEFVLAIAGARESSAEKVSIDSDRLLDVLTAALPGKQAVEIAAELSGQNKNDLYRRMLVLKEGSEPGPDPTRPRGD
jgi:16S rRNA (cytidine1402-2'-O)-methyltransferase